MTDTLARQFPLREELIDGKLFAMSPSPAWNHVSVSGTIYHLFKTYLKGRKCMPIPDGCDLHLTKDNVYIPDVMIVCDRSKIKSSGVYGAPDLVVEVLSPGSIKNDRGRKKDIYAKCGVREYWIVSASEKTIEVYWNTGNGEFTLHDIYTVYPDWALEQMSETERADVVTHFKCSLYDDFEIPLYEIFEDILP